jgi:RecA-family ATPase
MPRETLMADPQQTHWLSIADFVTMVALEADPSRSWYDQHVLTTCLHYRQTDPVAFRATLVSRLPEFGINLSNWFQTLFELERATVVEFPVPESLAMLGATDIPALTYVVAEFLHEGLWLFAGASKRGKSWLLLDMCLSIALGNSAFGHFVTTRGPVLYIALEDGRRRVKERATRIVPDLARLTNFDLLYTFPRLDTCAATTLEQGLKDRHYAIVVIDVVGGLLGETPRNKTEYQSIYAQFSPLRLLANDYHVPILLVDHLRKAQAEDIFLMVQGSNAKVGAVDAVAILERKEEEEEALLHIRSKEMRDVTLALRFCENRFHYMGEGNVYKLKKEAGDILSLLAEEQKSMSVKEIMLTLGVVADPTTYHRFRQTLQRLYAGDFIARTSRGHYAASRGIAEHADTRRKDDVPF